MSDMRRSIQTSKMVNRKAQIVTALVELGLVVAILTAAYAIVNRWGLM